ncbi:hypothetical protein TRFO_14493 [Tritrichomonas foetus]|uniref:Uncharacterized protein n=1 Tax=Tritrichomonas foetus TaxID=1144522 RepID=A0A1J4KZ68_9EUKA|nr:hypothetical protein TRFO_14493 [Tritrichomonas foetus]|eukprot:OHT15006.1 hypothetical protein TRFO_14493 [Tritrichomonas foetus]
MIFFLFTPLFFALSETRTIYFGTSRGNKRVDFSDLPKQNGKNLLNDFSAWYYVHLDSKTVNFESVSQKFQNLFLEKNMISKNIYQLYLSQKQIRELAENGILDIQELSSSDKVYVDIDSQYHTVGVHDSYQLEENPHLYKVISKSAPGYYVVELSQNHKNDAISFLSNLKGVNLLTNYVEKAPINNYAAGFTQNNDQPLSSDKQSIPRYLEGKGISGKGQVVTVFDTPIDVFHADFYDEKKEVAFNTVDNDHRKIVYYGYKGGIEELKTKSKITSMVPMLLEL